MKKIFAMLMIASMIAFTSCSSSTTEATETNSDSTAVVDSSAAMSVPTVNPVTTESAAPTTTVSVVK